MTSEEISKKIVELFHAACESPGNNFNLCELCKFEGQDENSYPCKNGYHWDAFSCFQLKEAVENTKTFPSVISNTGKLILKIMSDAGVTTKDISNKLGIAEEELVQMLIGDEDDDPKIRGYQTIANAIGFDVKVVLLANGRKQVSLMPCEKT